ncbi:MAG: hypothetical protein IKX89_01775 [Firmicutes bacterium]|nr:hypothetical protein [Bacillota bacterium]
MNLNRYISSRALCPLYKYHDAVSVYCDGEEFCRSVRLWYPDSGTRREHMRQYCETDYGSCRICRALMEEQV